MKKKFFIIFISIGILGCNSLKEISETGVGIKNETGNPNIPYIYVNGFRNFEIKPILSLNAGETSYVNSLRFNAVYSCFYTQRLMFDKFGKWDKEINLNKSRFYFLVWENRKLFDNNDKLFSVIAFGIEEDKDMYASVIVFDNENRDCLSLNYPERNALISFFSNGIKNLSPTTAFRPK